MVKNLVANLVIYPSKASFKFTSGESADKLWLGINKYHSCMQLLHMDVNNHMCTHPGGAPYDGLAVDMVHHNNIAVVTIYSTLTSAGLVYTLICLGFNILFRNTKYKLLV